MSFCIVRFFTKKELIIAPEKYVLDGFDASGRKPYTRFIIYNPENLDADVPSRSMLQQFKRESCDEKDMEIGMLYPALIFGIYGNYNLLIII